MNYYMHLYNRYNLDDVHDHEDLDVMILEECQECINRERAKDIAELENLWTEEHY